MPQPVGSVSASIAFAAIAASTALPPAFSTSRAAWVASGWLVATIPLRRDHFAARREFATGDSVTHRKSWKGWGVGKGNGQRVREPGRGAVGARPVPSPRRQGRRVNTVPGTARPFKSTSTRCRPGWWIRVVCCAKERTFVRCDPAPGPSDHRS